MPTSQDNDRGDFAVWAERFRAVAATAPGGPVFPDGMARGFSAWRAGAEPGPVDATGLGLDDALWLTLAGWEIDVDEALDRASPEPGGFGALVEQESFRTIEVWTETELSSLQALWRLGLARDDAGLIDRAFKAARWHLEHLQPDNGTNRPWSAGVFVCLEAETGDGEAGLYAGTLVQNCVATTGVPDGLSAASLEDGAEGLGLAGVRAG